MSHRDATIPQLEIALDEVRYIDSMIRKRLGVSDRRPVESLKLALAVARLKRLGGGK